MVRLCTSKSVLLFADAACRILDTFGTCLTSHIVYYYLVINYMNPSSILATPMWCVASRIPLGRGNSNSMQEYGRESLYFDRSTSV